MTARTSASSLVGAVSAYGFALGAGRLVSLIAVPLVTWALAPKELGAFAVLNSAMALAFAMTIDFGLDTASVRMASDERGASRASIFTTLLLLRLGLTVVVASLLSLARDPLATLLLGDASAAHLVPWLALTLLFGSPARVISNWLRVEGRHRPVAFAMGLVGALEGGLFIVLVYGLRWGLTGLIAGRVAAQALALIPLLVTGRAIFRARPRLSWIAPMLRMGLPFAVLYLLYSLREVDRFLVAELASLSDAGVYDLAVRVAAPLAIVNMALTMALEPWIYARHTHPDVGADIDRFLRAYVWVGACGCFVVGALAPELVALVGPEYRAAAVAVPAMLFLELVEGVRRVAGLGGELANRTSLWASAALLNAIVVVGVSVALIPSLPQLGAPIALVAGATGGAVVANALAERIRPLGLRVGRSLTALLVGAAGSTLLATGELHWATTMIARVVLALSFAGVTALALGVRSSTILSLLRGLRGRREEEP